MRGTDISYLFREGVGWGEESNLKWNLERLEGTIPAFALPYLERLALIAKTLLWEASALGFGGGFV